MTLLVLISTCQQTADNKGLLMCLFVCLCVCLNVVLIFSLIIRCDSDGVMRAYSIHTHQNVWINSISAQIKISSQEAYKQTLSQLMHDKRKSPIMVPIFHRFFNTECNTRCFNEIQSFLLIIIKAATTDKLLK